MGLDMFDAYNDPGRVGEDGGQDEMGWNAWVAGQGTQVGHGVEVFGADYSDLVGGVDIIGAATPQTVAANKIKGMETAIRKLHSVNEMQTRYMTGLNTKIDTIGKMLAQLNQQMRSPRSPALNIPGTNMRVQVTEGTKPRELIVPVDSGAILIPPGATVNVPIFPQTTFRLDRFLVANSIAPSFDILDLRVGKDSQFVSPGALAAEILSNLSVGAGLRGDTAVPGIIITVTVNNKTGAAARFQGAIIGLSLLNQ